MATTTLTLLRGSTTTPLGDVVDDNSTPVTGAEAVPGTLVERSSSVFDPNSGAWRQVDYMTARLVPGTFPAVKGDRVRDEGTGIIYFVERVKSTPRTIAGQGALSLRLSDTAPA